ncbi:undecaprenyl-diphosphate phosphatase [Actinospica durhamensis]|uniref:Undecaprenyl-diphosphatase n=1 Tax=Actinospica durhamensis TaxID=1508375 RepID=A0A941EL77_9ACTN|nr:undecaprenyl-diphosphate phosphatase [Actinospica durhamensis]MBR7834485.1 undecaprenyl-diphosphate phosphatase [Actinospica durhamensis]
MSSLSTSLTTIEHYAEAMVLGLIQGVTELFPVSSLGHSVLIPAYIGGQWASDLSMTNPKSPYLALIVALHVATALALLVFFRDDWVRIVRGLVSSIRRKQIRTPYEKLAWLLVFSTIPVGIAGVVLDKLLRTDLGKPVYAGAFLMLNGLVLYAAEKGGAKGKSRGGRRKGVGTGEPTVRELDKNGRELPPDIAADVRLSRLSVKTGMVVGAAEIAGLFPGLSRSGATIAAGLFKGLSREDAARFAFLLATPVILLAGLYKVPTLMQPQYSSWIGPALAGSVVAFIASYFSVKFLVRYFENKSLIPFAIYCGVFGLISVVYFA